MWRRSNISDLKLVRLFVSLILNNGVKDSSMTNVSSFMQGTEGVYTLDAGATLNLETKKNLTPNERVRKYLLISFLMSLVLMVVLGTIGDWLPDAQLGRELILVGEVPAFASSVFAARILVKERKTATPKSTFNVLKN